MKEKKFYFKSLDGLQLCGILTTPANKTEKAVILCHGMTVTKEEGGIFTELAQRLAKEGFAVLRFDFRSHGESEGDYNDFTVSGEIKDVKAAHKLMKSKGYNKFGILAASFGGGPTTYFVSRHPEIKVFVLWNPVIDYDMILKPKLLWPRQKFNQDKMKELNKKGFIEVGSRKFKIGKPFFKEIRRLKPYNELKKIKTKILFVHGNKDTHVPYPDSVKYSKMIGAKLETIKGADHGFHAGDEGKKADKVTIAFIKAYLK